MPFTIDDTFLAALADAVAPLVAERLLSRLQSQPAHELVLEAHAPGKRARKAWATCYVKGCKNPRANRYGGFCAAEHKDLNKVEKSRWKKLALDHP